MTKNPISFFNSRVVAAVFALVFSTAFVMSAVGPAINVSPASAVTQGYVA